MLTYKSDVTAQLTNTASPTICHLSMNLDTRFKRARCPAPTGRLTSARPTFRTVDISVDLWSGGGILRRVVAASVGWTEWGTEYLLHLLARMSILETVEHI